MYKYVDVHPGEVVNETEKGRDIYFFDKDEKEVYELRHMSFCMTVEVIKEAKENPDRYVFWYEEETEETAEN